jgi:hypothetical protein
VTVKNTTIINNKTTIINNINNRTTIINAVNPLIFPGVVRPGVVVDPRFIHRPGWWWRRHRPIVVIPPGGIIAAIPVPVPFPVPVGPVPGPVPDPVPDFGDVLARLLPAATAPEAPPMPDPADPPRIPAAPIPPAVPEPPAAADQEFSCRYIRVHNNTGENLKVFVQYRTRTDKGEWGWFPTPPGEAGECQCFDFKDGMTADLTDAAIAWRINACQVRIWAVSESGKKWLDFQDADLVVVPEKDAEGEPAYRAPEMQTYLFTFAG